MYHLSPFPTPLPSPGLNTSGSSHHGYFNKTIPRQAALQHVQVVQFNQNQYQQQGPPPPHHPQYVTYHRQSYPHNQQVQHVQPLALSTPFSNPNIIQCHFSNQTSNPPAYYHNVSNGITGTPHQIQGLQLQSQANCQANCQAGEGEFLQRSIPQGPPQRINQSQWNHNPLPDYKLEILPSSPINSHQFVNNNNHHHHQGIRLPPLANLYDFKRSPFGNNKYSQGLNTKRNFKFKHQIVSQQPPPPPPPPAPVVTKKVNKKSSNIPNLSGKYRIEKTNSFKPNTKFLSKIIVDEEFLMKHIKHDPNVKINFEIEVQQIELSKDQITKYVVIEFLFDILKFNDKRDCSLLIDNVPENRLDIDIKFELETTELKPRSKLIKIWLNLLKPSDSSITKEEISIELNKYIDKFMEWPDFNDPNYEFINSDFNDNMLKPFRPTWRLGAKDELSVIDMKIEIEYPESTESNGEEVENSKETEEEGKEVEDKQQKT